MKYLSVLLLVLALALPVFAEKRSVDVVVADATHWTEDHSFTTRQHHDGTPAQSYCNGNINGEQVNMNCQTYPGTAPYDTATRHPWDVEQIQVKASVDGDDAVLECSRNVRWSKCTTLHPGSYKGETDGKNVWVKAKVDGKQRTIKYKIAR